MDNLTSVTDEGTVVGQDAGALAVKGTERVKAAEHRKSSGCQFSRSQLDGSAAPGILFLDAFPGHVSCGIG